MFGTKFKSSKPINLEKPLRTYITKHYGIALVFYN